MRRGLGEGNPLWGPKGGEGRGFLLYLHFYIPSKLQLEFTKLFQDGLGLRRQVDLQG